MRERTIGAWGRRAGILRSMRGDGVRYQGAVIRAQRLLLIQYQPRSGDAFWLFPGGGRGDETPEECVARELHEETGLRVDVGRVLLEQPAGDDPLYRVWRTYLCSASEGDPQPGAEPETPHLGFISAVGWFDLLGERSWEPGLKANPITYTQVLKVRSLLGYG